MRNTALRVLSLGVFLLFLIVVLSAAAGSSGYHIAKKAVLGGDGGWDYLTVDSKARRVYVSRGSHVMVVDADSGALVGDIPGTNGVHGIAIASDLGKGLPATGATVQ
jgi:hypothetical protein